ncbi:antibiotic biosynthesis monooxygenase family protein [Brasilonema octagenarum]|uniref:Antibiotic biosynthesis monooxygenase n=1 Tax=Brasilonema octagenarum UFV-OR1 TaxID=417115 RepID=A0ABX1MC27_9CYAN|nr:antibiotic biosynthesis monooxygenase [Brasilonema octagenarum]NMF66173.1 antibiotic biosynthesis monooxygenase [Brasilonema octagenarum UFV-OR1]
MTSPVTLINVFAVPQGKEAEFIKTWNETGQSLKNASGFIDAKLHRSLDPNARFQFINVAHWESVEAYQVAISEHEPQEKHLSWLEVNPALYIVEAEY